MALVVAMTSLHLMYTERLLATYVSRVRGCKRVWFTCRRRRGTTAHDDSDV